MGVLSTIAPTNEGIKKNDRAEQYYVFSSQEGLKSKQDQLRENY
jgi:hypothetical protein